MKEKTESQSTSNPIAVPGDIRFLQMEEHLKFEIQVRKQAEDILATHRRILEQLAKGNSLQEVLDLVSINLERQMGDDATSAIYMIDEDRTHLILKSAPHLEEPLKKVLGQWEVSETRSAFGTSAFKNKIVIVEDIASDPQWVRLSSVEGISEYKACWSVPIPDPMGKSIGVVGIICHHPRSPSVEEIKNLNSSAFLAGMAITRKRYEEELKNYSRELARSNQDLEEFASIASHDLQEPLRKVAAFGERLKKTNGDNLDKNGQDYLERMLKGTARMQQFITDLLTYSRAGVRSSPLVPTDLNALLKDVLVDFEFRIEETGAAVEVKMLPVIEADKVQVRQVFANLIGNALKFIREGEPPRITISSRKVDEHHVEIIVEDNGIGFENKLCDRIFKPFERLNPSGAFAGSGMGLALCRKIIERHGGTVTASSTPGEGTRIALTFPVHQKIN